MRRLNQIMQWIVCGKALSEKGFMARRRQIQLHFTLTCGSEPGLTDGRRRSQMKLIYCALKRISLVLCSGRRSAPLPRASSAVMRAVISLRRMKWTAWFHSSWSDTDERERERESERYGDVRVNSSRKCSDGSLRYRDAETSRAPISFCLIHFMFDGMHLRI